MRICPDKLQSVIATASVGLIDNQLDDKPLGVRSEYLHAGILYRALIQHPY